MTSIKYVEGDLFDHLLSSPDPIFLPHVVNSIGVAGSGFVVPLCRHYPVVRRAYTAWHSGLEMPDEVRIRNIPKDFALGAVQFVEVQQYPQIVIANMVAQRGVGGPRPLVDDALATAMQRVAYSFHLFRTQYTRLYGPAEFRIFAPMFGAHRAKGSWDEIEQYIQMFWVDDDIDVTIFYLKNHLPPGVSADRLNNVE